MPRNDRFGYIFAGNSPNLPRLIAHELGHGAFALRHTFDSEYGGERSFSKTQNLMDYAGGTQLASFQWNALHSPHPSPWLTPNTIPGLLVGLSYPLT